jgi:hypothetical protein
MKQQHETHQLHMNTVVQQVKQHTNFNEFSMPTINQLFTNVNKKYKQTNAKRRWSVSSYFSLD